MSDDLNRRAFLKKSVTVSAGVASALSLGKKALDGFHQPPMSNQWINEEASGIVSTYPRE